MLKPRLQALVLADHVYQDKTTGKMIIAGTFNRLHIFRRDPPQDEVQSPTEDAQQPPGSPQKLQYQEICKAGSPWAYVSLTELRGEVPMELRYVDLKDNLVLLHAGFFVKADSPLDTREVAVPLPVLPTPHPGTYVLELLSNDEPLGSHRIIVTETPTPDQPKEESKT